MIVFADICGYKNKKKKLEFANIYLNFELKNINFVRLYGVACIFINKNRVQWLIN